MLKFLKRVLHLTMKNLVSFINKPKTPRILNSINPQYRTLGCNKEELRLVSETNAIFHVVTESNNGYFCPCRQHDFINEYVSLFIDDYYSFVTKDTAYSESDKLIVKKSLKIKENFELFIHMGSPLLSESPCATFLLSGNPRAVGLEFDATDVDLLKRMKYFIGKFAWCQLNAYYTNRMVGYRQYHTFSANKSLATESLARILGLHELFPHAEYAYLNIYNHRKLFGIYIERADGKGVIDIPHEVRRQMITPEFQRAMINLNVLDVITHEMDHSPNNYYVVTDHQGMAVRPSVFDNNGVGTFSLNRSISFHTYKNCTPFLNSDGIINRPYLDKNLIERIRRLRFFQLFLELRAYLSVIQIFCVWARIRKLKEAVVKTDNKNPYFLLDLTEWTEETINTELNGEYGKTYLESFIQDCCVPDKKYFIDKRSTNYVSFQR